MTYKNFFLCIRATAMLRIQTALRQSRAAEAVALLHAARCVNILRELSLVNYFSA